MCPGVQRNISFLEVQPGSKGITGKKFLIQSDGIKGNAAKECVRLNQRMCSEKVLESMTQKPCIMNGFVFIRRIGFLFNGNFRTLFKESLVVKLNVLDDAESICNNPYLIGVAEIPIDIELLDFRIGC